MAVEACFEFEDMAALEDCFMPASAQDGFCFQEPQNLHDPVFMNSYHHLSPPSSHSLLPMDTSHPLSCKFEKQRLEMDWFIHLESKRFRRSILEEETRQQAVMMQQYEWRLKTAMMQKDEELAMAKSRTRELQGFLKGAEMEARAWEKAAKEREALVSDLTHRLNLAREGESSSSTVSFCDSSSTSGGERERKKMSCKLCQSGRSCVVLFPCRHLCCCKACEPLLDHFCPLCLTLKDATLEVFLD